MPNFGWSYPPGCSGPPDEVYDDSVCVTCCKKLPEPDPDKQDAPEFEGYCNERCRDHADEIIKNIQGLAGHLGIGEKDQSVERARQLIARSVYKYTDCGCSFRFAPPMDEFRGSVSVAGYCEGTDQECPAYTLEFPFWPEAWDAALKQADEDGTDMWDDTHGCETCAKHFNLDPDTEYEWPIWDECPECKGLGEVK